MPRFIASQGMWQFSSFGAQTKTGTRPKKRTYAPMAGLGPAGPTKNPHEHVRFGFLGPFRRTLPPKNPTPRPPAQPRLTKRRPQVAALRPLKRQTGGPDAIGFKPRGTWASEIFRGPEPHVKGYPPFYQTGTCGNKNGDLCCRASFSSKQQMTSFSLSFKGQWFVSFDL